MTLASVKPGQTAVITSIESEDESAFRLAELGLVPGREVSVIKTAPLGDPIAVKILNYELCLRRREAGSIMVEPV